MEIMIDDPRDPGIRNVLEDHWQFAAAHTRPEDIHALDIDGLLDPTVTFFSLRSRGDVLAVGALKDLGHGHLEIKSMHTAAPARGKGLARILLTHLLNVARQRDAKRVSLETGSGDAFAPARALYSSAGFVPCAPFGDYPLDRGNSFMTLHLTD